MIKKESIKKSFVQIRVTAQEKLQIEQAAQNHGYVNVSAFILWLVEKYGTKNRRK